MTDTTLSERKERLERKLARHGISTQITYLPYLEFDANAFVTPFEVGSRMIILYALSYTAGELEIREQIANWLKKENLWDHVSPTEKEFFEDKISDEQQIIDFSWQIEGAYILAWALNLVKDMAAPTEQISEEQLDILVDALPPLGDNLSEFLSHLHYREMAEIYDENLFNELATGYFRDLHFNGNEDKSDLNSGISYIRHRTLNWVRQFSSLTDWDNTDTST